MKTIVAIGILALLAAGEPAAATTAPAPPKTAVCAVCRMHEGETKPERVAASSEYQGQSYYFCSKACKQRFDAEPATYVPPVLPRPAPDFSVRGLDGNEFTLKGLHGRTVLLDFWATWCKPCVETMPVLQRLHDDHAEAGFTVIGISIDEDKPGKLEEKVRRFVEQHDITYPIALDRTEGPAWKAFGMRIVPTAFLIDPEGRIVAQWTGKTKREVMEEELLRRFKP